MRGDRQVDAKYARKRERFGSRRARANGYRYDGYFRREQALLFALMDPAAHVVLDSCCGSGLMLAPLLDAQRTIFGVDFNADACRAASANQFPIVRGDGYCLPLADNSVDEIINCQFFNQQNGAGVRDFILEAARVLKPAGRVILVWRNGGALIHRFAHAVLQRIDVLRGLPTFPQVTHAFDDIEQALRAADLVADYQAVSCPPIAWHSRNISSFTARMIGASCIVIGRKPG